MPENPLRQLHAAGQSIWLDFIDRGFLATPELARLIGDDALAGMTSNPTIFEKALAQGSAYDEQLRAAPEGLTAEQLFELIATEDVRAACDMFRPVYDATKGHDGYVSLEVSPALAGDAEATILEARRLWRTVERPNVMIKVPGTPEGAHAARRLLADGVNVNITLLFAIEAYATIIDAYLDALEERASRGLDVAGIASVASFFVSRVDTEIDARLDALAANELAASAPGRRAAALRALRGRAAIANARLAYALFRERFSGPRWDALRARGARVQRPLWASTSTKNPAYRDVVYVEALIGPETVNTMPPPTLDAFRDHGVVQRTVDEDVAGAEQLVRELGEAGIRMSDVTDKLLVEGLASFRKSYEGLLVGLGRKVRSLGRAMAAAE
ncbi:MAG TPA: transaldolase [Gemmatimonadaceae bacterium]|nr:transaldolase [Gemmatimonadaceae bacterium]